VPNACIEECACHRLQCNICIIQKDFFTHKIIMLKLHYLNSYKFYNLAIITMVKLLRTTLSLVSHKSYAHRIQLFNINSIHHSSIQNVYFKLTEPSFTTTFHYLNTNIKIQKSNPTWQWFAFGESTSSNHNYFNNAASRSCNFLAQTTQCLHY